LWHTVHTAALDAAYESPRGLFVLYDPQHPGGGREIRNATLYDVMPTLLALFGITPPRTRGKALV
jgi:arylsulfatase A-like enzyme